MVLLNTMDVMKPSATGVAASPNKYTYTFRPGHAHTHSFESVGGYSLSTTESSSRSSMESTTMDPAYHFQAVHKQGHE